jgi:hypothetical protein
MEWYTIYRIIGFRLISKKGDSKIRISKLGKQCKPFMVRVTG